MKLSIGGRRVAMTIIAATFIAPAVLALMSPAAGAAASPALATASRTPAVTPAGAAIAPEATAVEPWQQVVEGFQPLPSATVFDGRVERAALQRITVTTALGVPIVDVDAIALRVRVRGATAAGSVKVWGRGPRPEMPTMLVSKGADRTQMVVVPVPASGVVTLQPSQTGIDATVEIVGYVPDASSYRPLSPTTVLDTRTGAALAADSTTQVAIAGVGDVPATGVAAVTVNIGVVSVSANTSLTVWPTGQARPAGPDISAMTRDRGLSTMTIVPVGVDGAVQVHNARGTAKVTIEVVGWFASDGDYRPLERSGVRTGAAEADATVNVVLAGVVPADTGAAVLALRSTASVAASVTAFPSGTERPAQPTLPSLPTVPATPAQATTIAVVPLGADGSIDLHTTAALSDLSVDVIGTFARAALAPAGSSWQFDPTGWITFTASGRTTSSNLVNIGADGLPTGAYLPAGTAWTVAGDPTAVTVVVVGRGRVRVTSTEVIGSVNVIATPVSGDQGMPLVVKNLRVQAGVRTVADRSVLYPSPTVEGGGSPAPFTMAEIVARTSLPDPGTADPFNSGARVGVVLAGGAPAVGKILAATGGSGVTGRVIAPAGLPSITRSGATLVTLELVAPTDVYEEMVYEIDPSSGSGIGANGLVTNTIVGVDTAFKRRPVVTSALTTHALRGPTPDDAPCETEANLVAKAEYKLLSIEAPKPIFTGKYSQVVHGRTLYRLQIATGVQWSGKAETSLTLQTEAQFKFNCSLKDLGSYDYPTPDPHLLTIAAVAKVVLAGEVVVPVGPRVELKYTCEWNIDKQFVLNWSANAPDALTVTRPSDLASSSCAPSVDATSTLLPRKVEAKVGIYAEGTVGLRVLGILAEEIGQATGNFDLGVVDVLTVKFGGEVKVDWETDHEVLRNGKAESKAVTQLVGEGELHLPDVKSLLLKFRVNVGIQPIVKLFEVTGQVDAWYRAPSNPTMEITINGDPAPADSITVYPGDEVSIESTMEYPNIGTMKLADPAIIGGTDWIETAPGVWDRFSVFSSSAGAPAPTLVSTATITPAICQSLLEPHAIAFLPTTKMLDKAPTAGWAGKVTMQCGSPTLRFEPDSVSFRPFETGTSVRTVQLISEHAKGQVWSFVNDDTIPVWLTVSDRAGGRFEDDPDTWDIELSVDCSKVPGSGSSTVLTASVGDALGRHATASLSVSTECREDYIVADPSSLRDGGTVNIVTAGAEEDRWTIGNVPSWVKPSIRFRDLTTGLTSGPVTLTVRRDPTCAVQPQVSADITFTTATRGVATVRVTRSEIPAIRPCPIIEATGDPHMTTGDGLRFDAQVVGEYVYARSADGSFVLSARHAATGIAGVGRPTSVTGVALQSGGSTVEVYAAFRAPGNGRLFIDGAEVVVDPAVPLAVNDTVRVTRQADAHGIGNDSYTISGPDGILLVDQVGTVLNVTFSFGGQRSDVTGLLGTPDGDPSNDLVPRGATTGFVLDDVHGHTPSLYQLTDSWRTIDLAASMFSVPDDVFDDGNWPMDAAGLAPFRAQAFAALGSITSVCGGDVPGANDYVVDALALELSIGTPLGDLGRFTCNYVVTADTLTASGGYPVSGVRVTFDAPGLTPCTAVSSVDGRATCRLGVDLDELDGLTGPLVISASAAWPDVVGVLDTALIPVSAKAPLDGTPTALETQLAIPIEVPQVVISGTLRNDVPTPTPWTFQFKAYDASGVPTGNNEIVVTPAADGTYRVEVPLPPRAVRVDIDVLLAGSINDRHSVTGLVAGSSTPVTIDVDDRAQRLRITGVMTYDGVPALGTGTTQSTLSVDQHDASGRLVGFQTVTPTIDPVTGAYSVDVVLSSLAHTVDLRAFVATDVADRRILMTGSVSGLAPGASTSATFDAIVTQPHAIISGIALQNGAPVPDHFAAVLMYGEDGTRVGGRVFPVDVDPVTGAYTLDPDLDLRTVRISVRFLVGLLSTDNPILEVTGLTPGSDTNVPFDFDVEDRTIVVSGTIRFGGEPVLPGSELDVSLTPYDSDGQRIVATGPFGEFEYGARPTTAAGGTYRAWIPLPAGTAEVRGRVSVSGVVTTFTSPVTGGENNLTVDVDTVAVTLSGNYGLAHDGTVFLNITTPADGAATHSGQTAFEPEEDGTYSVTFQLPEGSTDAKVAIVFGTDTAVVTGLVPGSNDRTHDWVPPETVRVTGTVTRFSAPATDLATVGLRIRSLHVNADNTFVELGSAEFLDVALVDGVFAIDVPVPPGTNLLDLDAWDPDTSSWFTVGANGADPGSSFDVRIEMNRYVEARFEYTDVAPACAPKVREVSIWLVPSDAGLVFPGVDGYPAPAQPFRTLLVVPGADFSELVRVEAVYDWSYAFMSRAPWGNPEEPTVSFQTEPVLSGGSWGISTSRAEYTCEPVE